MGGNLVMGFDDLDCDRLSTPSCIMHHEARALASSFYFLFLGILLGQYTSYLR